jgi:transcriptional regulator with XRE-family HTH domain
MPPVSTVRPNGPAIRALRHRRGLTLKALGLRIGRHGQAIRNLEAGERLASEVMINQIANALDVDVSELCLTDDDEPERAA